MELDTSGWSGEGLFTQALIEQMQRIGAIAFLRVEDAPATRSDADYNFISNELYVGFAVVASRERFRRFGLLPASRTVHEPAMSLAGLQDALAAVPEVGAPDYSDEAMLQYLRTERIVPPYQTRGYKLVELVRIYPAPAVAR